MRAGKEPREISGNCPFGPEILKEAGVVRGMSCDNSSRAIPVTTSLPQTRTAKTESVTA